eukprot:scaffold49881_cov58-Phaeocystis_antarctica.AAC.3
MTLSSSCGGRRCSCARREAVWEVAWEAVASPLSSPPEAVSSTPRACKAVAQWLPAPASVNSHSQHGARSSGTTRSLPRLAPSLTCCRLAWKRGSCDASESVPRSHSTSVALSACSTYCPGASSLATRTGKRSICRDSGPAMVSERGQHHKSCCRWSRRAHWSRVRLNSSLLSGAFSADVPRFARFDELTNNHASVSISPSFAAGGRFQRTTVKMETDRDGQGPRPSIFSL